MSTHKKQFLKRRGLDENKGYSLSFLSKETGISRRDLQKIYDRGTGAWKTNIQSVRMKGTFKKNVNAPRKKKLPKEMWAKARVYAFLNKLDRIKARKQSRMNQDCDIARKYYKKFKCV